MHWSQIKQNTCFKQDEAIFTLNDISMSLKLEHFTYSGSNISSTESDVNICIGKAWNPIERLSTDYKAAESVCWVYRFNRKLSPKQSFLTSSYKYLSSQYFWFTWSLWGCPRGVMVKAMDCGIVVSEFLLQSHYYVNFRANNLGKGMNPLILPAMG